jgi:hypothetical protein
MVIGDLEKYGPGFKSDGKTPICDFGGPYQSLSVAGYPGAGWTLVYDGTTKIYRRTT